MASYLFDSITSTQALAYNPATDELVFLGGGAPAASVTVALSGTGPTLTYNGRTVTFGAAFTGDGHTIFGDGSHLFLGTGAGENIVGSAGRDQLLGGGGDDTIQGGGGSDIIDGGAGVDTLGFQTAVSGVTCNLLLGAIGEGPGQITGIENLTGGALGDTLSGSATDNVIRGGGGADLLNGIGGDDTLEGGRDQDTLQGGEGANLFILSPGDSPAATPDVITDWTSDDHFQFGMGAGAYQEASAPDAGRSYANSLIAAGARYVAMQTPQGVILYLDSAGDGGSAEDAVLLSGRSLNDISGVNVGAITTLATAPMGPAETATNPPPTPPGAATGTAGADTLAGGTTDDSLSGLGGGDSLFGGAGNDTLDGGAGADTLVGGPGADLFVFGAGQSGTAEGAIDQIRDFEGADHLSFAGGGLVNSYVEIIGPSSYSAALSVANARIASGEANFVAVHVNSDTYLFVDSRNDDGQADDAVLVSGSLSPLDVRNLIAVGPPPSQPSLPGAPSAGVGGASGTIAGDMDHAHLSYVLNAVITDGSSTFVTASTGDVHLQLNGFGFATDANGQLAGGVATSINYSYGAAHGGPFAVNLSTPQVQLTTLAVQASNDATSEFFNTILGGSDYVGGGAGSDLLHGYGGNDLMYGGGGADTLWGGSGNDVIYGQAAPGTPAGAAGSTYLRGEDGNDYIIGGEGFDDINGNQGNDTASGGIGDDWVVGGKDSDLLFGDAGNDLVYGNLGADTCVGGDGNDIVRGGQDNDVLFGGGGDDFVSGDKGDDTVSGGAGADIFHTFGDAGIDRVLDFHLADGDRVMLDPGTQYKVDQVGADTVISMTGGAQMILVGVQLSSLTGNWIFGA